MKTGKHLMLDWFERVWRRNDINAIAELMAPDCIVHGLGVPVTGPDEFKGFHHTFIQAFGEPSVDVFEIEEIEDKTIGHATFRATHKSSNQAIEFVFSFSVRWQDGKAIEARNVVDFTSMLAQIGAIAPNTLINALLPNK
ncbi:ester cyclase [Pelagicoccus mobilis]|uniref:Ester cyclase n=1 Tax=Pelagicoccus mobilis TaxID=415221 RepID=A0A934RV23_9BACT|nr:ester cyclase [Pelagicoccus mobilis]MBK1876986.1 ester cyclase [Pelagicoccus mobilis]